MRAREMAGGNTVVVGPGALYDMAWVGVEAAAEAARGDGVSVAPVVVDVGGGLGQLVREVVREVEGLGAGQCVLQDRREVIEEARGGEGLEGVVMMAHDFHEEQPVKGEYFPTYLPYLLGLPLVGNGCPGGRKLTDSRGIGVPASEGPARLLGYARHGHSASPCRCSACGQPEGQGHHYGREAAKCPNTAKLPGRPRHAQPWREAPERGHV